ncbi:MAG: lysylphosphatidylglycerol synthase transmembrane domain-containing protein [Micavibrio sp.]
MRLPALNIPLKVAISAVIIILLLSRMDVKALGEQIAQVQITGMIWAGLFILMQIGLLAWRWSDLINMDKVQPGLTYSESLKITLASLLANVLFITSISGLVVRVGLTIHHGINLTKTICAAIVDRLMTLFALMILAAAFVPLFDNFVDEALHNATYATLLVMVFTVMIFIPLFFSKTIKDTIMSIPKIDLCLSYLMSAKQNRTVFARIIINSMTAQIFYFIAVYFVALSSGLHFSFLDLMTVLPVITLIASLPVSFGGWGVREGAFVLGLALIGIPEETAFLISIQIGLLTMIATIVSGIPALLSMDMKKIAEDVRHLLHKTKDITHPSHAE